MKQSVAYIIIIGLCSIFPLMLLSCSKDRVKDDDKFARIYVELLINQEKAGMDSVKVVSGKQEIFRKYNVTSTQFEATTDFYNKNPEMWKPFFEKADIYLASIIKNKNIKISPPQKIYIKSRRSL